VKLDYFPLGDTGIQLLFSDTISEETNRTIKMFVTYLEENPVQGVVEWVPAFVTLSIYYRPEQITYHELRDMLQDIHIKLQKGMVCTSSFVYKIPTLYGGEVGTDLSYVAAHNGICEEEVIAIHSSQDYLIYMMGFVPGFPYLGGVPKTIATPRRKEPRLKVMPGSVGIAGEQTGIYPLETPGGWQIIGQTPLKLYDPNNSTNPILLSAGDYLRFVPINKDEFVAIEKLVQLGEYVVTRIEKKGGTS
jgi:inhibitor of KinA